MILLISTFAFAQNVNLHTNTLAGDVKVSWREGERVFFWQDRFSGDSFDYWSFREKLDRCFYWKNAINSFLGGERLSVYLLFSGELKEKIGTKSIVVNNPDLEKLQSELKRFTAAKVIWQELKDDFSPVWNPKGDGFLFQEWRGANLNLLWQREAPMPRKLLQEENYFRDIKWSPSARYIAYVINGRLWLIDLKKGRNKAIDLKNQKTKERYYVKQYRWLPKDDEVFALILIFPKKKDERLFFSRIDLARGLFEILPISGVSGQILDILPSPDAKMVAIVSKKDKGFRPFAIHLFDLATGSRQELFSSSFPPHLLAWNGKRVIFLNKRRLYSLALYESPRPEFKFSKEKIIYFYPQGDYVAEGHAFSFDFSSNLFPDHNKKEIRILGYKSADEKRLKNLGLIRHKWGTNFGSLWLMKVETEDFSQMKPLLEGALDCDWNPQGFSFALVSSGGGLRRIRVEKFMPAASTDKRRYSARTIVLYGGLLLLVLIFGLLGLRKAQMSANQRP